jgi:tRNA(fMet)-specific endonuclease VapC
VKFLLDTNLCVFLIRSPSVVLREHFQRHEVGEIGISAITVSELRLGAEKSSDPARNHALLDRFLLTLPVLDFDSECARECGRIRAFLEKEGIPLVAWETLIAAQALRAGLTIVTNVPEEFRRVPGLSVVDWTQA